MATSIEKIPVGMMLTSYPEKFSKLYEHNQSITRIFHIHELLGLSDNEIKTFYTDIFAMNNISIEESALDNMAKYSSGMPTMMQEIGDATFWKDTDNYIDRDDSLLGVIEAGQRIGLKYLQLFIDKKIRSENYLSLFKKLVKN